MAYGVHQPFSRVTAKKTNDRSGISQQTENRKDERAALLLTDERRQVLPSRAEHSPRTTAGRRMQDQPSFDPRRRRRHEATMHGVSRELAGPSLDRPSAASFWGCVRCRSGWWWEFSVCDLVPFKIPTSRFTTTTWAMASTHLNHRSRLR